MQKRLCLAACSTFVAVILVACGSGPNLSEDGGGPGVVLKKEDFKEAWPFTVDEGLLRCDGRDTPRAITFRVGDKIYPINRAAEMSTCTNADLDEIWAKDPAKDGDKKSLDPILRRGRDLWKEEHPGKESESNATETIPPGTVRITRSEFGERWPFTVDEGVLAFRQTGRLKNGDPVGAVTFTANGKTYGVNGIARGKASGHADIEEILADDPAVPGLKKNISPIIERGLKLSR